MLLPTFVALALVYVSQRRKVTARMFLLSAVLALVIQSAVRNAVTVLPANKARLLHAQRAPVNGVIASACLAHLHLVKIAADRFPARVSYFLLGTASIFVKPREHVVLFRLLRFLVRYTLARRLFVRRI